MLKLLRKRDPNRPTWRERQQVIRAKKAEAKRLHLERQARSLWDLETLEDVRAKESNAELDQERLEKLIEAAKQDEGDTFNRLSAIFGAGKNSYQRQFDRYKIVAGKINQLRMGWMPFIIPAVLSLAWLTVGLFYWRLGSPQCV